MLHKEGYEMVYAIRELTSQSSRRVVGEADCCRAACLCGTGTHAAVTSILHRGERGLRRVPGGKSRSSKLGSTDGEDPTRSARQWESGDKLHRVCEPPEMTCQMLAEGRGLRRGSVALTDSQRVISPSPKAKNHWCPVREVC